MHHVHWIVPSVRYRRTHLMISKEHECFSSYSSGCWCLSFFGSLETNSCWHSSIEEHDYAVAATCCSYSGQSYEMSFSQFQLEICKAHVHIVVQEQWLINTHQCLKNLKFHEWLMVYREKTSVSYNSLCQMWLIDTSGCRKSINIIDINRFKAPIFIDWYRKSIEIEVTEKIIYRLISTNNIDNNR